MVRRRIVGSRPADFDDGSVAGDGDLERAPVDPVADYLAGASTLHELSAAIAAVDEALGRLGRAVDDARAAGYSWQVIGDTAGISRQAAHERWGRRPGGAS